MANNKSSKPERTTIGGSLNIPRMISGLWQLAGGHDQNVDVEAAAKAMEPLIEAGLDCFDMADHYGDAELRFIKAAGGWSSYQVVLQALSTVAKKHGVGISAVATRHVLDLPAVSAVIVGSRLSSTSDKYTASNLEAFSFALDAEDMALIAKAQEGLSDIPGDCGDEYRRPPFLTAKGDLSDHLGEQDQDVKIAKAIASGARIEYSSGSYWEPIASYCRAVRTGNTIRVSGTTANSPVSSIPAIGGKSARSQTVAILDIVARAIKALGGDLSDVVQTRIFLQNEEDVEVVSLAHGWAFKCVGIRPSNTLVVSGVIGDEFLAEIEVEAELGYREVVRI